MRLRDRGRTGGGGAVDQPQVVGPHQPRGAPLGNVAGKGERTGGLVDRKDGAHQRLVAGAGLAHRQREAQRRGGQAGSKFAEVGPIEFQGRFAVELVEHLPAGAGDAALRAEVGPAATGAQADPKGIAIQAHRAHLTGLAARAGEHPGALETTAIAGQPARDGHGRWQSTGQAVDQRGAVDPQSVGKDQHGAKPRGGERLREPPTGRERVDRIGQWGEREPQPGALEAHDRHAERVIAHRATEDLARGGAARDHRGRQRSPQLGQGRIMRGMLGGAEHHHQGVRAVQRPRQRVAPAGAGGMRQGVNLHGPGARAWP